MSKSFMRQAKKVSFPERQLHYHTQNVTHESDACILDSADILLGRIIFLVKIFEVYTTYTQSTERSPMDRCFHVFLKATHFPVSSLNVTILVTRAFVMINT